MVMKFSYPFPTLGIQSRYCHCVPPAAGRTASHCGSWQVDRTEKLTLQSRRGKRKAYSCYQQRQCYKLQKLQHKSESSSFLLCNFTAIPGQSIVLSNSAGDMQEIISMAVIWADYLSRDDTFVPLLKISLYSEIPALKYIWLAVGPHWIKLVLSHLWICNPFDIAIFILSSHCFGNRGRFSILLHIFRKTLGFPKSWVPQSVCRNRHSPTKCNTFICQYEFRTREETCCCH